MSDTRKIIDYTFDDNAVGVRDALYAAIHDKVTAHIEDKKQEIARGLIAQQDEETDIDPEDDDNEPEEYDEEEDLEEDVEELDELSKSTLASYTGKAYKDQGVRMAKAGYISGLYKAGTDKNINVNQLRKVVGKDETRKDKNRDAGVNRALGRLTKEAVGEMHPDADKVLKHIKPEHHDKYKPYLEKGTYTGSYSDRAAILGAAEKAGHAVSESSPFSPDYKSQTMKPGEKAGFTSKKISTGTVYSRKPVKDEPATPSKKK